MADDNLLPVSRVELNSLLTSAVEEGATRALKEVGLDDKDAANDIRELRALMSSWKEVRKSAIQAIVKFLMTAVLGAMLLGVGIQLGGSNLLAP